MTCFPYSLIELLNKNSVKFKELNHGETTTSEQSAQARGLDLRLGGKSILVKGKSDFHVFVISAALQIDLKKVRKILNSQKLRMATQEELMSVAGVVKGAMPPFGYPVLPLDLYVDLSITKNSKIAFNAGVLTKSLIIDVSDYLKIANPTICEFAKNV